MNTFLRNPFVRTGALIVAVALLNTAGIANAQNSMAEPKTQQAEVPTSYEFQASNEKTQAMSFAEVKAITQGSIRAAIGEQLGNVTTDQVNAQLSASFESLAAGHSVSFVTSVSGQVARSIAQQHAMQVQVNYEARPIGGILTIRVALVPVFSGIGAASRPVALKTFSQAVDNLDQDAVSALVSQLTHDLGNEFAAK